MGLLKKKRPKPKPKKGWISGNTKGLTRNWKRRR